MDIQNFITLLENNNARLSESKAVAEYNGNAELVLQIESKIMENNALIQKLRS